MTDRAASRALLGKGSIYTLATAAQLAGALLVQPALSRLLSRVEYGRAALAIVVTSLLGLLLTVGLPAVITREYFQKDGRASARVLVSLTAGIAVVLGGVALALGPIWAAPLHGFDWPLALGTATAITFSIITTGQAVMRAQNRAGRFVVVVIVNVLGGQLAGLAGVVWIKPTAAIYLAGVGAGSLIGALLSLWWVRPAIKGGHSREKVREWFRIALPTIPHTAALFLMTAGDRFVVEAQRGQAAVGAYSLAYLVGALGTTLVAAANNAWAPLVYSSSDEKRWEVLSHTTRDMLRVAAILAGGLALTAPLTLAIVADPSKYDIASLVPVVALTALSTIPYVIYLSNAHVLFWTGKTKALLWITPLAAALNLAAKALVLPWGGFVGAAVVTVLSYSLLALLVAGARRQLATIVWSGRGLALAISTAACVLGAVLPDVGWAYVVRCVGVVALLVFAAIVLHGLRPKRDFAPAPNGAPAPAHSD